VPRSGAEARRRLQQAALELYQERGYERTTAAEIAARAGVNERTFFRHFPDKREVLFDREADLRTALTEAVAAAPDGLGPFEMLFEAFRRGGRILAENRPFAAPRLAVIAATPALRERELAKHAALIEALAEALRARGVDRRLARLAAQTGWATFEHALEDWLDDSTEGLDERLRRAFDDLYSLSART